MKTYDSDIHKFKLLETVSFVGVLEFTKPHSWQDSQMTEVNDGDFGSGAPSDSEVPHLHVISHQRNYIMNRIAELPATEIKSSFISDQS